VALVFGREHAGLTNDELLRCQYHIQIPSNPAFSSLNLAASVQIMAYEIRMKLLNPPVMVTMNQDDLATNDDMERFYSHLTEVLLAINFLKVKSPGRVQQRLRRLFNRVGLEAVELNMLRGMLTHIQRVLKLNQNDANDE
jgi:tRNA (cytidine32/uridine32-2'-O)-methyltransferase